MIQFLLAAPRSGSGKTTMTCALLMALKRRGYTPCAFKSGPDYIDPMFHRAVLGVESHNLDLFFSPPETVRVLYAKGASGHGAAVCEGAMGFYDGLGGVSDKASAWHLADTLGLPVLGFLPKLPEAVIGSRHLGLYTAAEVEDLQKKLAALAAAAEEQIDWPRLLALCEKEPPALSGQAETPPARVRIAVAQDEAFCFTYAETLEALRDAGAEPVFFSPLRDASLPEKVGGLYLPGGYPELHARALSENNALLREIKKRVEAGLPTVAECGGFLYLGQRLTDTAGQSWPMAGVLPGTAQDAGRLVRFGYAELGAEEDSMLFRAGEHFPIHEFHHWDSTANGTALTARKPVGGTEWRCGFANEHFYAGFPHLYWAGTPLPQRFAAAAEAYRRDHD